MNTLRTEIESANKLFMAAVQSRDEEGFVRLYTPDAILLLPGRDPLVGAAGVRTFFASFAARGISEVKLTTIEAEGLGDMAWERGSSEAIAADGSVMGRGKYIVIWKRDVAGWKLHRDILNAST